MPRYSVIGFAQLNSMCFTNIFFKKKQKICQLRINLLMSIVLIFIGLSNCKWNLTTECTTNCTNSWYLQFMYPTQWNLVVILRISATKINKAHNDATYVHISCINDSFILLYYSLWSPYRIGQTIIFLPCGYFFLFFPCLMSAAADWMSAILPHMVWP